jgi:predicted ATPase/DNA-binding SARP family transcriptional activator
VTPRQNPSPAVAAVAFRLLGPVDVTVAGRSAALGGARRRAVLALLLLARGASVSEDALTEALWGDDPPPGARNSLQSQVSRLRCELVRVGGAELGGRLRRGPGGYHLRAESGEVDCRRVEALVAQARASTPAAAVPLLLEALSGWRGPPLHDLTGLPGWQVSGLAAARARFDELEAALRDQLCAARLRAGDHVTALPELEQEVARQPLREGTHRLLALALHRDGRPADALEILRRFRARLRDEVGLDPSAELETLQRQILHQDPVLSAPSTAPTGPARLGSWRRPHHPTPLVGRADDLVRLASALHEFRLITVTGPGGVGKSRFVAEALARGGGDAAGTEVVVLELAPLRRRDAVAPALAALLGVRTGTDTRLEHAITAELSTRRMLLVIDNCEHLLADVAGLVKMIAGRAPGVTVLATSRRRLGVDGEQVLPLDPLPVPPVPVPPSARPVPGGPDAGGSAAVELFVDRARRVRPGFALTDAVHPLVAELCRRLDGLPLAIELAAGQLGGLGVADLVDRLDDRLDLLAAGECPAPDPDGAATGASGARHATLRAVLDWSFSLLAESERRLLEVVSVFDGGFTLVAAERIVDPAAPATGGGVARVLTRLVEASLVTVVDDGEGRLRYQLLETVRTYAAERLASRGVRTATARRHLAWVVHLAESAERGLDGPDEARWVRRLDAEFANIRSAWHFALADGCADRAARISVALAGYAHWQSRSELWAWARTLAAREDLVHGPLGTAVLGAAAQAAYLTGDLGDADRLAAAGLAPLDSDGHRRRWWCTAARYVLASYRTAYGEAEDLARRAAAAPGATPVWRVVLLGCIALARLYRGDISGARTAVGPCQALAASVGAPTGRAWACYVDGEVASVDDPTRAPEALEEAVRTARSVGASFVEGVAAVALLAASTRLHDHRAALRRFPDAVRHWQRSGMRVQQWTTLRILAELLVAVGADEPAAVLLAAAEVAADAPAVVGGDADRLAALQATIRTRIGPERAGQAAARGASLTGPEVVVFALDHALPAGERALAGSA